MDKLENFVGCRIERGKCQGKLCLFPVPKACINLSPYSAVSFLSLEVMPDGESMISGLNSGSALLTV